MPIGDWPVERDRLYGCWRWQGKRNARGYPVIWGGRTPIAAHVAVYRAEVGDPGGLPLDHLCRDDKECVCPWHLEPVTKSVNEMRKLWRVRARMTTLPCGHEFRTHGILTRRGGKVCRCALKRG